MPMIISFNATEYAPIGAGTLKMLTLEYDSEFCYDF